MPVSLGYSSRNLKPHHRYLLSNVACHHEHFGDEEGAVSIVVS